jgi:hypothetical protein
MGVTVHVRSAVAVAAMKEGAPVIMSDVDVVEARLQVGT